MNTHKRIIGTLWIVTALILAVLLLLTLDRLSSQVITLAFLLCVVQLLAGYSLLKNLRWSHWLNLPLAVVSLSNIPLGTFIGAYYLWYYFKHEWRRPEVPPTL
jgi:drug/metabolite transporter (DMT)-like permease